MAGVVAYCYRHSFATNALVNGVGIAQVAELLGHSSATSPILIVLDNHGYGTERYLQEGEWKYNEIHPWNYHKLPAVYGGGTSRLS